jgi:hypothetical protein
MGTTKNLMAAFLSVFIVFFIVDYSSYTWDPCTNGNCLTIYCPGGECEVPAQNFIVKTLGEVKEIVNNNGTEHLKGIYKVEYRPGFYRVLDVTEMEAVPQFDIEEKRSKGDKTTIELETFTGDVDGTVLNPDTQN